MKNRFVLLSIFVLLILHSCKTKEIITEKTVYKTDSLAITKLKTKLDDKTHEVVILKSELYKVKTAYTELQNEVNTHNITYDTSGVLNPETWRYPLLSETITSSKIYYINRISELEFLLSDKNNTIDKQSKQISDLSTQVNKTSSKETDFKSVTTIQSGFNIKSLLWGMAIGSIISLVIVFRNKIKPALNKLLFFVLSLF